MINHRRKRSEKLKVRLVVRRTRHTDRSPGPVVARLAPSRVRHQPDHWRPSKPTVTTSPTPTPTPTTPTVRHRGRPNRHRQATIDADRHHRAHASCELAIRDLKEAAGLAHLPSGVFFANAAWLLCAALAHNLYRHIAHLGRKHSRRGASCVDAPSAPDSSAYPDASSTTADNPSCGYPPDGPGPTGSYLSSLTNLTTTSHTELPEVDPVWWTL